MSDDNTINGENVVAIHELVVTIAQTEDGKLHWRLLPDAAVWEAQDLGLFGLAECGWPLAALAIRALWKMCDDGIVFHALEQACGVRNGVARLRAAGPVDARLVAPMECLTVN